MKQVYERENVLLGRKRYAFELEHPGQPTPKKEEIAKQLAEKLKVTFDKLSVRHIYTNFGKNKSKILVHVYEDPDLMKLLETPKGKKEKKK